MLNVKLKKTKIYHAMIGKYMSATIYCYDRNFLKNYKNMKT